MDFCTYYSFSHTKQVVNLVNTTSAMLFIFFVDHPHLFFGLAVPDAAPVQAAAKAEIGLSGSMETPQSAPWEMVMKSVSMPWLRKTRVNPVELILIFWRFELGDMFIYCWACHVY